jgi:hypothetical protein
MKGQLVLFRAESRDPPSTVWSQLPEEVRADLVAQFIRVVVEPLTTRTTIRPSRRTQEKR